MVDYLYYSAAVVEGGGCSLEELQQIPVLGKFRSWVRLPPIYRLVPTMCIDLNIGFQDTYFMLKNSMYDS